MNIAGIAGGGQHSLVLKNDGTAIGWGSNDFNQTNTPSGLSNVVAIAGGTSHSVALVGNVPPVLHAHLTNLTSGTNGFSGSLPTQSGRVYRLEYKHLLTDTKWTALSLIAGNGGLLTLTDTGATNDTQRFYRVRRW